MSFSSCINRRKVQLFDAVLFISILSVSYLYPKYCNLRTHLSQELENLNNTRTLNGSFLIFNRNPKAQWAKI